MDGHELMTRRKAYRLSIHTVARAIGVSPVSVWRWEAGTRRMRPAFAKLLTLYFNGKLLGKRRVKLEEIPSPDEPHTSRLTVRLTERQLAKLKRMADRAGLGLGETLRAALGFLPEEMPRLTKEDSEDDDLQKEA